jgi:Predicted pPIWI-associating nuclease
MIRALIEAVDGFLGTLRRRTSVNVNDQQAKEKAIELATHYFSEVRTAIVGRLGENDLVLNHDGNWQELIRLAHGNNMRKTYIKKLSTLKSQLSRLNVDIIASGAVAPLSDKGNPKVSDDERLMIETLEKLVPSAANSYRQGLLDLRSSDRISYRGTAVEFREALREVLDHLAPDADVMAQSGFKLEPNQSKPTMKQKVRFVLISRGRNKTQREAAEKSISLTEEISGDVARAIYNRASVATHLEQGRKEVGQIKRYVNTVLYDLLEIQT